jgi:hypothetical protein
VPDSAAGVMRSLAEGRDDLTDVTLRRAARSHHPQPTVF